MKPLVKIFTLVSMAGAFLFSAQLMAAAKVEITWIKPDKYADVKDPFDGIRTTQEDAFYNIEKYLNRLAKKLPDGYLLKVDVTDLDLAGETHTSNVRVVRQMFPPRIAFSYKLLDSGGNVMLQSKENIRDTSFLSNISLKHKNEAFGFEKQLLEDWFKDSFSELYAKN